MLSRMAARPARLIVVLAAASLLVRPVIASAHASLVRATIRPGQVFARTAYPRVLTAVFAENVDPKGSFIHVFEADPRGDHALADRDNVAFPFKNPKEMTVGLPTGLRGTYTVLWYTVSADDGHKAGSTFTFTIR
jgi:methionine-rich copper-binding protein CopC